MYQKYTINNISNQEKGENIMDKSTYPEINDSDFTDEELDLIYGTHKSHINRQISCQEDAAEKQLEEMGCY